MNRKPLIMGNWKMNLVTGEAIKLVTEILNQLENPRAVDIAVAPPFTSLNSVEIALQESPIHLAAQNCHFERSGAFTGEISVAMLKDIGCKYVLIGHSERRHVFNENNEFISNKIASVIHGDLIPVLCVGETLQQRKEKTTFKVLEEQLKKGLSKITLNELREMEIAYEPVWAIGTGENASPSQAQEVHQHIRNNISIIFDKPTANKMRILYGGSVNPNNCAQIMEQPDVDGLLIGGASLSSQKFTSIIRKISE